MQTINKAVCVVLFIIFGMGLTGESRALNINAVGVDGLTEKQAMEVLRLALNGSTWRRTLKQPEITIEGDFANPDGTPPLPGYYMLRLVHDAPKSFSSMHLGTFAVGKLTADVWDIAAPTGCKNFHSPELSKLQAAVMRKTKGVVPAEKVLREKFDCDD